MWLWALVGVLALFELLGFGVDVMVPLGGAFDSVGEVEPGVKPLRAVGGGVLVGEHVAEFVIERLGVFGGVEVAESLSPMPPASCEAVEDLAGIGFCVGSFGGIIRESGLAEVLLGKDVGGDLRPMRGHHDVFHEENLAAVGVLDLAPAGLELNAAVGILSLLGK